MKNRLHSFAPSMEVSTLMSYASGCRHNCLVLECDAFWILALQKEWEVMVKDSKQIFLLETEKVSKVPR